MGRHFDPAPRQCRRCSLSLPHDCVASAWPSRAIQLWSEPDELASLPEVARAAFDAAVAEADERAEDIVVESILSGVAGATRCASCGAVGGSWRWSHLPGCDLDRSISASTRYLRRNPEVGKRHNRKMQIKRRWAALNGRCALCVSRPTVDGLMQCKRCRDRGAENRRLRQGRAAPAIQARTSRIF